MKKAAFISGLTALELTIAVTLGAVVISAAYKAQISFSKAASRENDKALLQRDLMHVCDILERDIRMAGLGLPGNGIEPVLSDTASDKLVIFINKDNIRRNLTADISVTDAKILVNNTGSLKWGGWVCLEGSTIVFKEISRIGECFGTNPDTIYLNGPINAGPFTVATTVAHSADRIVYCIKNGTENNLIRGLNKKDVMISTNIDSLSIIPKTNNGIPLSSGNNARVITAILGGYIGKGANRNFIAESTEVNIRNSY